MKDALRLVKGYISHEIERFSLKPFCFSQRQNLLQVNARTEGYWQVSLRSWRYCLGARLKFWRRSCDLKKGVERGVWVLFLAAYAAKSHSTTTQYRQLHRLLAGGTTKFDVVWRQQWVQNISQSTRGTTNKSVFGDVPGDRLQSLKTTLLKSDQYYSHFTTYYLISWLLGWSLNWELT